MSRYVHLDLDAALADLAAVRLALDELELRYETAHAGQQLMLEGSLECAGEPVDLRFAAGTLDTVEDFGLVREAGGLRLVCGELDLEGLRRQLLAPLTRAMLTQRLAGAQRAGLTVEASTEVDGTTRIRVRTP
ncbi:MAG: hypothetical protein B7733_10310 [Myxococcales bacterium FL481]|nr:MAG: hypothetical protein B7733_10310 [Myxococcales bacterium FL481]